MRGKTQGRKEKGTSQTQRPASPQRSGPEVGRRIRQMRGFDMTHEEFAERIGINQNYSLERGKGALPFPADFAPERARPARRRKKKPSLWPLWCFSLRPLI